VRFDAKDLTEVYRDLTYNSAYSMLNSLYKKGYLKRELWSGGPFRKYWYYRLKDS